MSLFGIMDFTILQLRKSNAVDNLADSILSKSISPIILCNISIGSNHFNHQNNFDKNPVSTKKTFQGIWDSFQKRQRDVPSRERVQVHIPPQKKLTQKYPAGTLFVGSQENIPLCLFFVVGYDP